MGINKTLLGCIKSVVATQGRKQNQEDLEAIQKALAEKATIKADATSTEAPIVEPVVTEPIVEGKKEEDKKELSAEDKEKVKAKVKEVIANIKLKKQAKEIAKKVEAKKKVKELKAKIEQVEVKAESARKQEVIAKIKARKHAKELIAKRIEAKKKQAIIAKQEDEGKLLAKKKIEDIKKKKKDKEEVKVDKKGSKKEVKKSKKDIISALKARLQAKKKNEIISAEPKYEVSVLEKKSPKLKDEEVQQAPQTKSKQLISMVTDLKELAELQEMKLDTIKSYIKQVDTTLNESFETAKHTKELKDTLDKVLEKNDELKTSTEKVIRINEEEVVWIDKTYDKLVELDKLSDMDKGTYETLKADIDDKKKKMAEIEAKVTKVDGTLSKIRYVIIKNQKVVSAEATWDNVLNMYDEANGIMEGIASGLKNVVDGIANWFKGIFKK